MMTCPRTSCTFTWRLTSAPKGSAGRTSERYNQQAPDIGVADRGRASVRAYHPAGFVIGPLVSVSVSGKRLALSGPRRSGRYQEAARCSSKLRLRLGSKTPTGLPSLSRTIRMGSSRSESLEITTAISYSSQKPSTNKLGREIDVGPLLLGVEDLNGAWAGRRRPRQRSPLRLREEVPVVDGQVRNSL